MLENHKKKLQNHLFWLKERGLNTVYPLVISKKKSYKKTSSVIKINGLETSTNIFITDTQAHHEKILKTENRDFFIKILKALKLDLKSISLLGYILDKNKALIEKPETYKQETKEILYKKNKRNIIFIGEKAYQCFFYDRLNWEAHKFKSLSVKQGVEFRILIIPDLNSIEKSEQTKKETWFALKKFFSI